ncbi:RNA polymerase subunit sigma [Achromobacter denitrificans]|jgi:RNA polymerase sigma factor (sigma-70 family)|uniref:sigma-70 family RNA polymerase sigma factor n=1 Tax=Achromobacter denitrificans TaxID=32002 RepID=UPI000B4C2746|nr:sigma-70 family RNA polymerase sigma factor [Achromobacter denitrificans]ASC67784.1 RNA polymerase subunit sigma [Achromobacter denitrificans]
MSNPLQPLQHFCENNYEWLCQWWRHRLGHGDEASDFAHDTFLRVLRNPEEVRALRQPRAYLTTVARGLLNDHWRRRSLERAWLETLAAMPPELEASPDMLMGVKQALQQLDRMLGNLAPQAREVFVLSQLEGLSYVEIAARTGLSDRTVKRYMAQGFEICLTMLEA